MKRFAMMLTLVAAGVALPGCVFAVGSKLETDQKHRLDSLDRRISAAESKLGITTPPAPTPMPEVEE